MKKFWEYPLVIMFLVLGFGVRMYKINNPVADWHSWRQADTAAVTRNFFKYGVNVFLPRYDDLSDVSARGFNPQGYRLVEFPLFNLIHYSLVRVAPFGTLEFWGRMVSVLASLVSALCLYVLINKYAGRSSAFVSLAVFLFIPFSIYFSRVILPDPLMVAIALVSLVAFSWQKKWTAVILGAMAVLVKPTAVFILLPVLASFRFAPLIILAPFLVWRIWQQIYPVGVPGSIWLLNGDGIRFKGAFFRWIFGDRLGRLILGYWGVWPALEGIINLPKFLYWLVGGSILYLFVFATGNVRHDYYQIPIVPAVAAVVGIGLVTLWQSGGRLRRGLLVVTVVFMLAFGWYEVRGNYQINNPAILTAGQAADQLLPADAIVIANYNGDTAFLYQTNRRGFPNIPLPLAELISRFGVGYYISVDFDQVTNEIMRKYQIIAQTPGYVIVKLSL